jgi:hypothetical protein
MGGDRLREEPDNVIPFPVPSRNEGADKLHNTLADIMASGDTFAGELKALLEKWKFKPSYIEAVVPELMDAYLNDDEQPIWDRPGYKPSGTDIDE